tara:strand:- start:943 stop:1170 length:228 start_codon:yes stop_codon:yes gene_type:complete
MTEKEKEILLGLVIQAIEEIGLGEMEYLKPLQKIEQKLTLDEETTPIHEEQCWNCKEDIKYTDLHSFCPECLTSL